MFSRSLGAETLWGRIKGAEDRRQNSPVSCVNLCSKLTPMCIADSLCYIADTNTTLESKCVCVCVCVCVSVWVCVCVCARVFVCARARVRVSGDLPSPGIKPESHVSSALAGGLLTIVPPYSSLKWKLQSREKQFVSIRQMGVGEGRTRSLGLTDANYYI